MSGQVNGRGSPQPKPSLNGAGGTEPLPRKPATGAFGKGLKPLLLVLPTLATLAPRWFHGGDSYAVCSAEGEGVYTVDATQPRVQCILVRGQHIQATGSLGSYRSTQSASLEMTLERR
jgi:hypothetical protein